MTGASAQHGRVLPQHAQLPILQPCQLLCGQSIANSVILYLILAQNYNLEFKF